MLEFRFIHIAPITMNKFTKKESVCYHCALCSRNVFFNKMLLSLVIVKGSNSITY